jgi:transposase InsO family protein
MNVLGLQGIRRGKRWKTTTPDPAATRPADLVKRRFNPARPNALWVADFTYVATWVGVVYVAFVIDAYARRILGWRAASSMRSQLVLDALEQAVWVRRREGLTNFGGLVHHTDAGSQGGFNRSSQHLDRGGVYGQANGMDESAHRSVADEVARSAVASKRDRARVLARDRQGVAGRGGRPCGRCVAGGGRPMVSTRWRHAFGRSCSVVWSLPVLP